MYCSNDKKKTTKKANKRLTNNILRRRSKTGSDHQVGRKRRVCRYAPPKSQLVAYAN